MLPEGFIILCIHLAAISATTTTSATNTSSTTTTEQPIPCDLSKRTESCPHGYCCARDEFLPEYVICKKYGKIHSSCATVEDPSVCPCEHGLKCIPNVNSETFVSIYGSCSKTGITTTVTTKITTINQPTTPLHTAKHSTKHSTSAVKHNSPPLIHLHGQVAKIYRLSSVNQRVTTFTVLDPDKGKNGEIQCSVLQSPYFSIKKIDERTFEVVLAVSLRTLAPQTIPTFIICEDSGSPKLNGLAQMAIQIVDQKPEQISPSAVPSTPSSTPSDSITMPFESSTVLFESSSTELSSPDMTSTPMPPSTSTISLTTPQKSTSTIPAMSSTILGKLISTTSPLTVVKSTPTKSRLSVTFDDRK